MHKRTQMWFHCSLGVACAHWCSWWLTIQIFTAAVILWKLITWKINFFEIIFRSSFANNTPKLPVMSTINSKHLGKGECVTLCIICKVRVCTKKSLPYKVSRIKNYAITLQCYITKFAIFFILFLSDCIK